MLKPEWIGTEMWRMLQAGKAQIPLKGTVELLPLCNLNCDMCYVRLSRKEMEAQGHMLSGEEWLKIGREMAQAGTLYVTLTGGEPLLHPDFREIYLGFRRLGIVLMVNTNATLIDEEWADFFKKYQPRRLNISIYGPNNEAYERLCHCPDGYDRVMRAVHLLRERNINIRQGFNITPENKEYIQELYRLGAQSSVAMQTATYMMPASRERSMPFEEQNRLMPEEAAAACMEVIRIEKGQAGFMDYCKEAIAAVDGFVCPEHPKPCISECFAGRSGFSINWQGQLCPCVVASEPSASVLELGFESAWKRISNQVQELHFCEECGSCRLRSLCPVCIEAVKLETGSYFKRPEYLCRYAAEMERLLRKELGERHG